MSKPRNLTSRMAGVFAAGTLLIALSSSAADVDPASLPFERRATWWETVRASRDAVDRHAREKAGKAFGIAPGEFWDAWWGRLMEEFPEAECERLSENLHAHAGVRAALEGAMEIHVAVDGDDGAPGTKARPLATLAGARDRLRRLRAEGALKKPVRVIVHGGVYRLSEVFRLAPEDSGAPDRPIVYEAAEGEEAILSAARPIEGEWKTDDGKIYYVDIPEARTEIPVSPGDITEVDYRDRRYATVVGKWVTGNYNDMGPYLHDDQKGKGEKRVVFQPDLPEADRYEVQYHGAPTSNRSPDARFIIRHAEGETEVRLDQRREEEWISLGRFPFAAGREGSVTIETEDTTGYVIAKKLRFVKSPQARGDWRFRQLFVDGRRETLARHPNFDPSDVVRKGFMFIDAPVDATILVGLVQKGDWIEYEFEAPAAGDYALWVGVATIFDDPHKVLDLTIDGAPVELAPIRKSTGWRSIEYSHAADVSLSKGKHRLRLTHTGPVADATSQIRVHLDALIFSDREDFSVGPKAKHTPKTPEEHRIVVQAEDESARVGGESSLGFSTRSDIMYSIDEILIPADAIRSGWKDAPQAELFTFPRWGWFNATVHVADILEGGAFVGPDGRPAPTSIIKIEGKEVGTALTAGNRFYIQNLLCELDEPGEWFLDYRTGRLWYWPRGGSPADSEILAPVLERTVELVAPVEGEARVEHVALRGLTFRHTDYTIDQPAWRSTEDCAVLLENAWHCAVEDCRFEDIGGYGVRLSLDSGLNWIAGNTVTRAGAGGVLLRGPWVGWGEGKRLTPSPTADLLAPMGNLISDNHVHHCGDFKRYIAGVHTESRPKELAYAPGNVYSHNHIHHMPRNGIFGFRNQGGYVVEYNHIHDCLIESDDGGLVHFCTAAIGATAQALYRNNLLHDAEAYRHADRLSGAKGLDALSNGHGLYLDGNTSYCTLRDNVISNTRKGCVFIHSGVHNTIENNIFLDDRRHQLWHTENWDGNRVRRNIFQWSTDTPYYLSVAAMKREPTEEERNAYDFNLIWRGGKPFEIEKVGDWETWRTEKKQDEHSKVADPGIEAIDLDKRILRLKSDSPAFSLGFEAIDLSGVGTRPRGARR